MKIKAERLESLFVKIFEFHGVSKEDSEIASRCLVMAEMAGISTHGIEMLPEHIKKCDHGYNTKAELKIIKESYAFTVCSAENAIGMASAWKCIKLAVDKSEISGIHTVFCNNANTFSAAYCYVKYAVEHGKIAIVTCNAPAQMAPVGGCEKLLGTNPLAIGVPANMERPFILDMATSAVAKSKINQALHEGIDKIPFGWAVDRNGNPTDNPQTAVEGLILPMAGAKGYGLAMAIDVISGFLPRAKYLDGVGRFYNTNNKCMNVGQTFTVIDPIHIYGKEFFNDMDLYLKRVRNSKKVKNHNIFVPGDLNAISYERNLQEGIEVSESLLEKLNALLGETGEFICLDNEGEK